MDGGEVDILLVDVNPFFPPVSPLGLEVLASAAAEEGFRAEIFSASPFLPDYARQFELLSGYRPRTLGMQIRNCDRGVLQPDSPAPHGFYRATGRELHERFPTARLILGGIGFSMNPQFWLREMKADYGIAGSGELPLVLLLKALLRDHAAVGGIPGLAAPGRTPNPIWAPSKLRRVRRDRLDYERWRHWPETGLPWANIETHRGCRFRCGFCVEPRIHGQKVAFKDPVDVIAEMRELADRGVNRVFFCSSEFNLDPAYSLRLCRSIAKSGLGKLIRWRAFASPAHLPAELCRAMVDAGCESISLNAIHVDNRILASFGCPHRRAGYERCLIRAARAGVPTSSTFLVGSALETDETVDDLTAFIDRTEIRANVSLGLARYPVLPRGAAMEETRGTRWFTQAGAGSVQYGLRLSPGRVAAVARWAASRPRVLLQNRAAEGLACEDGECPEPEFSILVRRAAGAGRDAELAVERLREALPLLDLPVVTLAANEPRAGALPEPGFRLYGPFLRLSRFYAALRAYLESPGATPDAIARLYLRLSACTGEFPRLLDAAAGHLDSGVLAWLRGKWERDRTLPQLVLVPSYACQARCPYCYAADAGREHPPAMPLDKFRLALDWAEGHGCRVISFAGGEPAFHFQAKQFFEEVRSRNLRTYFNSNLLCAPETIAGLDGSWVTGIGVHAQAARYAHGELAANLQRNVDSLRGREVPLFLRYNFESLDEESLDEALALARELQVRQVNFAFPVPSPGRRNRHIGERDLLNCGRFLVRVTEAFRAEGLKPVLSKPVPACAVPEDKLAFLRAGEALAPSCNIPNRGWTQNVLVGPDLTVSPCVGLPTRGPSLLSFRGFEEISGYVIGHLRAILRPVPYEECRTCNFYTGGRCLGGCLAYFGDREPFQEKVPPGAGASKCASGAIGGPL
jgi:pyruvate-formate lyase-activating enzyme